MRDALEKLKISFDVDYPVNKDLRYIHKVINGSDVYYFANVGGSYVKTTLHLKGNQTLEAWDPHSGETIKITSTIENKSGTSLTSLPLNLTPFHSVFLISVNQ